MKAVIGLGFGDEGKGLTTSFLCSNTQYPIVVRFNGGPQAGHTVQTVDRRHVFAHFGSGTLQGAPTYWSEFCTFDPSAFWKERKVLEPKVNHMPAFYAHPLCPVTTPFDVLHNRATAKHGTVGMGFGTTIERQEKGPKLYLQDLWYEEVFKQKLKLITQYYSKTVKEIAPIHVTEFLHACSVLKSKIYLKTFDEIKDDYEPIFEGAQGIMLDQDFGYFPYVTRSNTTTKNIWSMVDDHEDFEIYYVTRCYATRHGDGPLPFEQKLDVKNEGETNVFNDYQKHLRYAPLNPKTIQYALACDKTFHKKAQLNLMITCLDQHPTDIKRLLSDIGPYKFTEVLTSKGPTIQTINTFNYY